MYAIRSYYAPGALLLQVTDLFVASTGDTVAVRVTVLPASTLAVSFTVTPRITSYNVCYTKLLRQYLVSRIQNPESRNMPKITLHSTAGIETHEYNSANSLLQTIQKIGGEVFAPCGGNGTCGKCSYNFV